MKHEVSIIFPDNKGQLILDYLPQMGEYIIHSFGMGRVYKIVTTIVEKNIQKPEDFQANLIFTLKSVVFLEA